MAAPVSVALASPSSNTTTRSAHAVPYLVALEEPRPSNQVVNVPEDPNFGNDPGQSATPYGGGGGGGRGEWILYVAGGAVVLTGIAYFAQGQKK